ncbi:MAG: proline--tRNA ligase [Candidatus Omnitrophica bacterium]|nr:proline--tRNA ligase [Candidatus Omnitrophota bacterium]
MRMTQAFIRTLKEDPSDAEVISHKLMMRAGLIRKLGSGAYTYLPLGFKVLKKVEGIVREEMDRSGAQELLMPAIHPRELWEKTGRYELLGDILIKYKDRHGRDLLLGPTHEEVITDLAAKEIHSYRDLPVTLYQIQTKFRDEPRPRFGVLRSKEFIMKDAYSFDADPEGLGKSYQAMYDAYCRIFDRCGLKYVAVEADSGFMGGDVSHEFMVPSRSGEDIIMLCKACGYSASRVVAECLEQSTVDNTRPAEMKEIKEISTPGVSSVEKVSEFLKVKPRKLVKTLICKADGKPVAILIRGDQVLNEVKLKRYLDCNVLEMADEAAIKKITGGPMGFSGPLGLKGVRIISDHGVKAVSNFVAGANKADAHLVNVNVDRDFQVKEWADLRYIEGGDICPKCKKQNVDLETAIEVGHTFKLGTKYSKDLGAKFLDKDGKEKSCIMGCYGIGVNRIIAASIEQNNDKDGIIWPLAIAPYRAVVLPLNTEHKESVEIAERIYRKLKDMGIDVLLDDRPERAGIKFKDADLMGIPLQIVVGEKALAKNKLELKKRKDKSADLLTEQDIIKSIVDILK